MKKIINLIAISTTLLVPQLVKAQASSPMEISATVIPGCFVEADNINFGNLVMPLINQSAQSNMRVKCSKDVTLNIAINYSGTFSGGGTILNTPQRIYIHPDGIRGTFYYSNTSDNKLPINNSDSSYGVVNYHELFGTITTFEQVENKIFEMGYKFDQYTSGAVCYNSSCKRYSLKSGVEHPSTLNFSMTSSYGELSGAQSNEKIKYALNKPFDDNTVWNNGNKYQVTSNGEVQVIPMKANIKSSENPTHRMTPDSYQDTLTVELQY